MHPHITSVIALLAVAVAIVAACVATTALSTSHNLNERLHRMETHPAYQGRDRDGNEVWAPALVETALPKATK